MSILKYENGNMSQGRIYIFIKSFFLAFFKKIREIWIAASLTDYAIMVNKSKQIKSFVSFVLFTLVIDDCGQKGQRAKNGFAFKTN